ncbi:hypothetical protein ASZ90_019816 [hydrocarbon metagenome]|uniref:Uncharacterized protein n=1 Tax=hydrocarbon metagenome TaxID=938273 RepID=A0A0W8E355_9ZZZZ
MGGGTPVIEANRLGHNVIGCDIILCLLDSRKRTGQLEFADYQAAARDLIDNLKRQVGSYYYTRCNICGKEHVLVKYYLGENTVIRGLRTSV